MPRPRPYSQKTIFELQDIYAASQSNPAELRRLRAELRHRAVPKANALADKVRESLAALAPNQTIDEPQTPDEPVRDPSPTHKVISCQNCGQGLRIELSQAKRQQYCPSCKATFTTTYLDGVLSVVFESAKRETGKSPNEPPLNLTLGDAYILFGADKTTAWEEIELTRRRLIQQYHPDKVAALGPKLREVAEVEAKRINIAADMIRKDRGL
jgi:hypothetical protein